MNKRLILADAISAIEKGTDTPLLPKGTAADPQGTLVALKHYTTGMVLTFLVECALGLFLCATEYGSGSTGRTAITIIAVGMFLVVSRRFPHNFFAWTAKMRRVSEYLNHAQVILEEVGCPQITLIGTWAKTENQTPAQYIAGVVSRMMDDEPGTMRPGILKDKHFRKISDASNYFFREA